MSARAVLAIAAACASGLLPARPALADSWPEWATQTVPDASFGKRAPAVELLRETVLRFDGSERYATTVRRVIWIRAQEGRSRALAAVAYSTDGGKVRSLRAWLKSASGEIVELKRRDIVDRARWDYALYNEDRIRSLSAADRAEAGSIFAWEAEIEGRMPVAQFSRDFQDDLPVARSRVRIEAAGWTPEARIWNHPAIEPARHDGAWTWEANDLEAIEEEPWAAPLEVRTPSIALTMVPAREPSTALPSFRTWEEVSRWTAALVDAQARATPALETKALALASGASSPEERVRAIARYVQGVNYVSIQMDVGRGGGLRPHPAADVLAKNYGDCKDKANLMRALLRVVGIESYLVAISATDPDVVRPEWPSPAQFNHCIIAVRVEPPAGSPVVEIPAVGRVALFDPTNPFTPWGALPVAEQGAYALVMCASGAGLLRTPVDAPERSRIERTILADLAADGSLSGTVRHWGAGALGWEELGANRTSTPEEYRGRIEAWINGGTGKATVSSVRAEDDSAGAFGVEAAFQAARFGRSVAGFLSVGPPSAPIRTGAAWPETRTSPLRVGAYTLHETGQVRLPAGYAPDELPPPATIEAPFASYRLECRHTEGVLIFERSLRLAPTTLPASEYAAVRRFFEMVRAAEAAQVLLKRG